jgi:hypothetical protein
MLVTRCNQECDGNKERPCGSTLSSIAITISLCADEAGAAHVRSAPSAQAGAKRGVGQPSKRLARLAPSGQRRASGRDGGSPGIALDSRTRLDMEASFGSDFSDVRPTRA